MDFTSLDFQILQRAFSTISKHKLTRCAVKSPHFLWSLFYLWSNLLSLGGRDTDTNSMCFQSKQGSNRRCSIPESQPVQPRFLSGTSFSENNLHSKSNLKYFQTRDNYTFRWFMNRKKKKRSLIILNTDYYPTLFKNTKGCFDRFKSTSSSHCPLYLAKRSPQLTKATYGPYAALRLQWQQRLQQILPVTKKHHKITNFTLLPLLSTSPKPSLQQQLHSDTSSCQDQPQASRLRISLVTSWDRSMMYPWFPFLNLCEY